MSRSHRSMTTRRDFSRLDRTLSSSMAGARGFTLLRPPNLPIATLSSGSNQSHLKEQKNQLHYTMTCNRRLA